MKQEYFTSYKYGLLTYPSHNLGDYIQSIAAMQFLPRVDMYINREYLNRVKSREKIKLILNGWFMHLPQNWPPSEAILPLFISFHISPNVAQKMLSRKSIEYFKKYEPIGTRDTFTMELLKKQGIDAYFSGCLTLTLNYKFSYPKNRNKILIIDLYEEVIDYLPAEIINSAEFITHNISYSLDKFFYNFFSKNFPTFYSFTKKIKISKIIKILLWRTDLIFRKFKDSVETQKKCLKNAEETVKKLSESKLVITSKLHCALPCLAFNTPVIFIHKNLHDPRVKDYVNFFHSYSLEEFKKKARKLTLDQEFKSSSDISELQVKLIKKVKDFVKDNHQ